MTCKDIEAQIALSEDSRRPAPIRPTVEEIMAIGYRFSSLPVLDARSDEEIIGYDENGIPKTDSVFKTESV